ncbi:hypothetical protein [Bacillus sp. AG4(2022)]|uniref:hypothetical protein n=1 Tax=Bacillus sp. AG4(2022) TaxID=2962594 RepID=UPI002882C846|nr:hypothetical protein [Bacillus sp. AG4(2022)]MDT0160255.1 hypothetical protein [Bacillus sp. AG4(2022)]
MNKIGRKIFYDIASGNVLIETGECEGNVIPTTVEQDIATYTTLSERNRESFDVVELSYGDYAEDFKEGKLIGVDLENKTPMFSYPNPEDPDSPIVPQKPLSVKVQELEIAQSQTNTSLLELMELVLLGGN